MSVTVSVNAVSGGSTTKHRPQTYVRPNHGRGVCRATPPYRYILGSVSMCGFVTTLGGGVCGSWVGYPTCVLTSVGGRAATFLLEHGLTFGVVELIFTYVCVCRIQ